MQTATDRRLEFCFLKDQRALTPAEFERIVQLREQVRGLVEGRRTFIEKSGRDPEIHLPRGNWELGGELYDAYRRLLTGDYAVVNSLRLFSQIFTGFQLLVMERCANLPIPQTVPPDHDLWLAERAKKVDDTVLAYLKEIRYLPEALHISPPPVFGEVGWLADGKIINHDTWAYLERMVLLAESGRLWEMRNRPAGGRPPHILEIGSGYGGLAYHIKKLVPHARYFCVDIPESLLFSSCYLSTLFANEDNVLVTPNNLGGLVRDRPGFTFVPNYLFDDCCAAGVEFDLVINTLSMSEMAEKQVRYYAHGIAKLIGGRGVFFEQNQDNRSVGFIDARRVIAEVMPFCVPLHSAVCPLTQGKAHLWCTHWLEPYAWLESRPYIAPPSRVRRLVSALRRRVLQPLRRR